MKKFFAVLVCSAVLLSFLVVPSFAASPSFDVEFVNTGSSSFTLSYSFDGGSATNFVVPGSGSNTLSLNTLHVIDITCIGCFLSTTTSWDGQLSDNVDDPSHFPVSSSGLTLYVVPYASVYDSFHFYIYLDNPLGSSDGVSSSIGFVGQVINFLTSNSTTIFAIGLSVAMLCVLPWGIRKLKGLIKGY